MWLPRNVAAVLLPSCTREGQLVDFGDEYASALNDFVVSHGHSERSRAIELGQQASARGLSIVAILNVHNDAVHRIQRHHRGSLEGARMHEQSVSSISTFFFESVAAYEAAAAELTHENCTLLQLNEALESQASRIAQAIHDDAGQLLTLAHLQLARAEQAASPECAVHLTGIRALFNQIEQQLRRFSHELHPIDLEQYGLISALEFLVLGVAERSGLNIRVKGDQALALPQVLEAVLYRFVQEALTNVARHAMATDVSIVFDQSREEVMATVSDNGIGFDAASCRSGMGLSGMRRRIQAAAGRFSVDSCPGSGTELRLRIPLGRQSVATPRHTCG
jgi:signal transduction histidine kinase